VNLRAVNDKATQCDINFTPAFASTPRKKATIEELNETVSSVSDSAANCDEQDVTYDPNDSNEDHDTDGELESEQYISPQAERKFIVFESCLLSLFNVCVLCLATTHATISKVIGTCCVVRQVCERCGFERLWESQVLIGNCPAGNVLLATAIVCSGACMRKVLRVFEHINCSTLSYQTLCKLQSSFVLPAIQSVWDAEQRVMFENLRKLKPGLIIGGDARADSPGHSAKYGSYTVMEMTLGKVITVELVQSNEVGGSYHMEKAGLSRALVKFHQEGLHVAQLVTDRHPQIIKWIATDYPKIVHMFDIWHVAKSVVKKLAAASKLKDCKLLGEWKQSIVNHMYWCATSDSKSGGDVILAKWLSVENHILNVHEGHSVLFPKCLHSSITRKWIAPHTKAASKLSSIVSSKSLCKDIKRLSPVYQTYCLEAFHSLIIQFAPKSFAYSYLGMKCRLLLAAMHFNENSARGTKRNADGSERCAINFPKAKQGGFAVRVLRESSTCNYVSVVMNAVIKLVKSGDAEVASVSVPPPLCGSYVHPNKSEAVIQYKSRFVQPARNVNEESDDTIIYEYSNGVSEDSDDTVIYEASIM
jgi:hypothetical protein